MRSLKNLTQRIFNNLINQNQKLVSDSVLKQSTKVPSVQSPASRAQSPESSVQRLKSSVQRIESSVQSPASRIQRPEFSVQHLRPESTNFGMRFPVHLYLIVHQNKIRV